MNAVTTNSKTLATRQLHHLRPVLEEIIQRRVGVLGDVEIGVRQRGQIEDVLDHGAVKARSGASRISHGPKGRCNVVGQLLSVPKKFAWVIRRGRGVKFL